MKLIDADKIRYNAYFSTPIVSKKDIDNMPTIEAIPKEDIDKAIAKIKRVINSGQFNEAVCFGLTHAMFLFKMATLEESDT